MRDPRISQSISRISQLVSRISSLVTSSLFLGVLWLIRGRLRRFHAVIVRGTPGEGTRTAASHRDLFLLPAQAFGAFAYVFGCSVGESMLIGQVVAFPENVRRVAWAVRGRRDAIEKSRRTAARDRCKQEQAAHRAYRITQRRPPKGNREISVQICRPPCAQPLNR